MANYLIKHPLSAWKVGVIAVNNQPKRNLKLWATSRSTVAKSLVFPAFGNPSKVVKQEESILPTPEDDEVVVRMLAAPVNPADINIIQGVYPVKPPLPAVGGNEGVGEVVATGSAVKGLKKGDRVVPKHTGWGTWRTHAVCPESEMLKVPKNLDILQAATLNVNPCTAYRMLKNFVKLQPGDVVIQNAANGSCGGYVIQLCKEWGICTINIVRDRKNLKQLKESLKKLGATHVITEEESRDFELLRKGVLPKPKLALNGVGGKHAMQMFRYLDFSGYYITYGGMSRLPVVVPTGVLIFRNVNLVGYWNTRWANENVDTKEWKKMYDELISLMVAGKLKLPPNYSLIPMDQFQEALENTLSTKSKNSVKYIFDFCAD